MTVVWKRVKGWPYEVSSTGLVRRVETGRCLSLWGRPYKLVTFSTKGVPHQAFLVHKLVAEAFLGKRPLGKEINHKDTNKVNNQASNLEYVTHSENQLHSSRMGVMHTGERNNFSKLKARDVLEIRSLYSTGQFNYSSLGRRFGVTCHNVRAIVLRNSWKGLVAK